MTLFLNERKFAYLPGCIGWARVDTERIRVSGSSTAELERSIRKYSILKRVEQTIRVSGKLTGDVQQALSYHYFSIAANIFRLSKNRKLLKNLVGEIRQLDPRFQPYNSRLTRLLVKIVGFENAIWLVELRIQKKREMRTRLRSFMRKII